ncbi:MAG: hypothetical protein HY553_22710 [Elusimicrobia bacterium]|nr:hypothetical protein [Elusimicrobiota bacterium]
MELRYSLACALCFGLAGAARAVQPRTPPPVNPPVESPMKDIRSACQVEFSILCRTAPRTPREAKTCLAPRVRVLRPVCRRALGLSLRQPI